MRWLSLFFLIGLVPDDRIGSMGAKPSTAAVVACACLAVVAMIAGVYFGGTGRLPLAMIGATLFVVLGGLAFELARRRSNS
jgi:hypothetical protein